MPGLLDVAPSRKTIPVNGTLVTVTGISAEGIALVLERFPEARMMLTGKDVSLSIDDLFAKVPGAVATLIAAGCGYPGDEAAEKIAAGLPVESQIELLTAIKEVTMPKGVGPFVDSVTALLGEAVTSSNTPVTKSPQPSNT